MNGVNRYELARRLTEELEAAGATGSRIWLSDEGAYTPVLSEQATTSEAYAPATFEELRARGALGLGHDLQPSIGFVEIDGWSQFDEIRRAHMTAAIGSAAAAMDAAAAIETAESEGLGTVLVADDDPSIRKLLRMILGRKGYQVIEAVDGREAVATARAVKPDLIVMDWEMPNLNGRDAAAALKAQSESADVPIVMLTSRSRIEDKVDALGVGVQDFITKPFDVREFVARIEQQVRWRRLLDGRGLPGGTISVTPDATEPTLAPLETCRSLLERNQPERALNAAMLVAEQSEEAAHYHDAAQAYALAAQAAITLKNPDVANKLQRLGGKMYLLLAEHSSDTASIQLGYTMAAKLFLTAGNLKLARDVAQRAPGT